MTSLKITNSPPDSLSDCRVAILGLGLMGGSLALALRGQVARLVAVDPDPATRALAQSQGVVDEVYTELAATPPEADLVILAAPVGAILELIAELPDWHPGGPVVMDLGSTKTKICQALQGLPARFDPLGGHPMAGKEVGGLAHATGDLFQGAPFALTPLARTSDRARALGEALARAVGARPMWLDEETHDRWTAATSHLPYLAAQGLSLATPFEAAPLVGSGFRSTSRLAETPLSMMGDVLNTNRAAILEGVQRLQAALEALRLALEAGDKTQLERRLAAGQARRRLLTGGRIPAQPPPAAWSTIDFTARPLVEVAPAHVTAALNALSAQGGGDAPRADDFAAEHTRGDAYTFVLLAHAENQVVGGVRVAPLAQLLAQARAPEVCCDGLDGWEAAAQFWLVDPADLHKLGRRLIPELFLWLVKDWDLKAPELYFYAPDASQAQLYAALGFEKSERCAGHVEGLFHPQVGDSR